MSTNKLHVETKGSELVITRKFDAPRNKVFEAHTDCKHLNHWWGPREWPLSYCNMDFRVGGKWHFCMKGPDGTEAWGLVVYREIATPERIAYEDYFSDKAGTINKELPATTLTMKFEEKDGTTTVTTTAKYNTPDELKKVIDMGMIPGMTETMERLEEYLVVLK